jgi:hypothetical protein
MYLNSSRGDGSRPPTWASKRETIEGPHPTIYDILMAFGALMMLFMLRACSFFKVWNFRSSPS